MKSKLMKISVLLLLALMAAPVMAKPIGPRKSNNPRIEIDEVTGDVGFFLPNGGLHSWMLDTEWSAMDFMHVLNASRAKGLVNRASTITVDDLIPWMEAIMNPETALEYENKWFYIPKDTLELMLTIEGQDPAMADMWPDGVHIRFVNVGPAWNA